MKRHVLALAAAATMLVGVVGGVSASAEDNNAPYEKSCVGIINSFQAAELGLTPEDSADLYFDGSVRAYQEMQQNCKIFPG
jgi:hypothetical protein